MSFVLFLFSCCFFFQEIIKNVKLNFSLAAAIAVNATSTVRAAGSPDVVFLAFVCCVCCTAFRSAEISFHFYYISRLRGCCRCLARGNETAKGGVNLR